MAVFKCKKCGAPLNIGEGANFCECDYCGVRQTVPAFDSEEKVTMFNRANELRQKVMDFDAASNVYQQIVSLFPKEAEAYWGLCLCKYGIEYVDDPGTHKLLPTCHRTSYDSILEDINYKAACQHGGVKQNQYMEEAKVIDKIQQDILEIANKEEPYDVFISFKDTDENGMRTEDSYKAEEIYYKLKEAGYKVFFSRVTLENVAGEKYEPYIFSALWKAKVMVVVGTRPEYINATWVKNEWARFFDMKKNEDKTKVVIPCYDCQRAGELPSEFRGTQIQEISAPALAYNLQHIIEKVVPLKKNEPAPVVMQPVQGGPKMENLLKLGYQNLEDGNWDKAEASFQKVQEEFSSEEPRAYLGKAMAELKISKKENIGTAKNALLENPNFKRAVQNATGAVAEELNGYVRAVSYEVAKDMAETGTPTVETIAAAAIKMSDAKGYKDADNKAQQYAHKAVKNAIKKNDRIADADKIINLWKGAKVHSLFEKTIQNAINEFSGNIYSAAMNLYGGVASKKTLDEKIRELTNIVGMFEKIPQYKDAKEQLAKARNELAAAETEKRERNNEQTYTDASTLYEEAMGGTLSDRETLERLASAISDFKSLGDYRDSKTLLSAAQQKKAEIEKKLQAEADRLAGMYNTVIENMRILGDSSKQGTERQQAYDTLKEPLAELQKLNYRNSDELADKVRELLGNWQIEIGNWYAAKNTVEDYQQAIPYYQKAQQEYGMNTAAQITACENSITKIKQDAAYRKKQKRRKLVKFFTRAAVLCFLAWVVVVKVPACVRGVKNGLKNAFTKPTKAPTGTPTPKPTPHPDYEYEVRSGAVTINKCKLEDAEELVIPDIIEGYPVTKIARECFSDNRTLTKVTLPSQLKVIENKAFYKCKNITEINFPEELQEIEFGAFSDCVGLTEVVLPDSLEEISSEAFYKCEGITKLDLGKGVKKIGQEAFKGCTGLTELTIPDSVEDMSLCTFAECGFTTLVIGKGMKSSGGYTFQDCKELVSVTLGSWATNWASDGQSTFKGCTALSELNLLDGVEKISSSMFEGCTSLKSVVIPDSVTEIGGSAFEGCTSLASVTIGKSVEEIGGAAFHSTALTSVTVPNKVKKIGDFAFGKCNSLREVSLGTGVRDMSATHVFSKSPNVKITFDGKTYSSGSDSDLKKLDEAIKNY